MINVLDKLRSFMAKSHMFTV